MIKENVLHRCVGRLLKYRNEAFPALDVEYAKMQMDRYFSYVNHIMKKKNTLMRVWLLPTELIDIKGNKWLSRSRQWSKNHEANPQKAVCGEG